MKGSLNEIDFHSEHGKEGSHGMAWIRLWCKIIAHIISVEQI
jgi:hypothetical protein